MRIIEYFTSRFSLILLLAIMLGSSCRTTQNNPFAVLERKAWPYDNFTQQRSWPDADFDFYGWQKAMNNEARIAREALAARVAAPCDPVAEPVNITPWQLEGPANVAGRVNTLAIHPTNDNIVLAGFAGGGIFKTEDAGLTWRPVFDDQPALSIGAIAYDPSNPNVVYAGTGDPNMPSLVYNGYGVYKSADGGESWTLLGLEQEGVVSKIVVHPSNSNMIWVGTMGNPHVRNNRRGVFKTTNGGQTWTKTLHISDQAGCSDLVMSPANPNILYASFWDRIRNNTESVIYGPHAQVWKSTNGGDTWQQLTNDLPLGVNGRTGLAISQQNADKLYVVYIDSLSTVGGLFKTTDGGQSFTEINSLALEDACADFGWYFGKLRLNPANDEDLYFLAILLYRKLPGANGFQVAAGGHADCHDLVFAPSGRRYWANDGGVYRNENGNIAWIKSNNLPATQVYRVSYNPLLPFQYWLGAQDNGIKRGNTATLNQWADIFPADGFRCAFDAIDPDVFWVEIQNGTVYSTTDGGQSWQAGQPAFNSGDRVNWDAPFFRSLHSSHTFFAGTYRVLSGTDGASMSAISPDLTDGNIYGARFHTLSSLTESPVLPGKLFAGTTDANVWRREPAGSWVNITGNLPNRYVTSVQGSPASTQRIYTTHSGYRDNVQIPHIHRSDDNGQTWIDISGDLPQIPVNHLFVFPGHADSVLVAATDAGAYFSRNGGVNWKRLGTGIPAVPVFDFAYAEEERKLLAATFGRGVWSFPVDSILLQPVQVAPEVLVNLQTTITNPDGQWINNVEFDSVEQISFEQSLSQYTLESVPGCDSIWVRPRRNDQPVNGVSTFDLSLINRHILGQQPINSPYKIIAADANRSKTITVFDVIVLRRLILGLDTAFQQNESWRFFPADLTFTAPANPFLDSIPNGIMAHPQGINGVVDNFYGVKIGDLDGSAIPSLQSESEDRTMGEYPLFVDDLPLKKGETIWLSIYATPVECAALQASLKAAAGMEILNLQPVAEGLSSEHFNLDRLKDGVLSFSWENAHLLRRSSAEKIELFRLKIKANQNGAIAEFLHLSEFPTPAFAYRDQGEALKPVLIGLPQKGESAWQIAPNPARNIAWVHLPADYDGGIWHVRAADGRLMIEGRIAPGTTLHSLDIQNWPSGWYLLETDAGDRLRFMVAEK